MRFLAFSILFFISSLGFATTDYVCWTSGSLRGESKANFYIDDEIVKITTFDSSGRKILDSAQFVRNRSYGGEVMYLETTKLISQAPTFLTFSFLDQRFWIDIYPDGLSGNVIILDSLFTCNSIN